MLIVAPFLTKFNYYNQNCQNKHIYCGYSFRYCRIPICMAQAIRS